TSPADDFQAMADWCRNNGITHDRYGSGGLVQAFEAKISGLLGFKAAKFCLTGVASQVVALRLACAIKGNDRVLCHPTSHLLLHENHNAQLYDWFKLLRVGSPYRPLTLDALQNYPDPVAAVIYELPLREIGGQLPSWEELEAIKAWAKQKNVQLHMDGARLWEAATGFDKSLAQVCEGFDSVYVSFYKGIGALAGAMLLGGEEFIKRARVDMQRQGAVTFRHTPYVASAAMQFDQRLEAIPAYLQRTRELYKILEQYPLLLPNPETPQCNMLHLYLPVNAAKANAIRDVIAAEHKIWLFNGANDAALPGQSYFEWYVGDNLLAMDDKVLHLALKSLSGALGA
ncbi:MAG: aminotransferase class I/II-fold pyridoxal phosphate-dependent enzyme, partial [Lysobacterales bacterium]